jgi:hypothetical protein
MMMSKEERRKKKDQTIAKQLTDKEKYVKTVGRINFYIFPYWFFMSLSLSLLWILEVKVKKKA